MKYEKSVTMEYTIHLYEILKELKIPKGFLIDDVRADYVNDELVVTVSKVEEV
jgi:hypothetical protein